MQAVIDMSDTFSETRVSVAIVQDFPISGDFNVGQVRLGAVRPET